MKHTKNYYCRALFLLVSCFFTVLSASADDEKLSIIFGKTPDAWSARLPFYLLFLDEKEAEKKLKLELKDQKFYAGIRNKNLFVVYQDYGNIEKIFDFSYEEGLKRFIPAEKIETINNSLFFLTTHTQKENYLIEELYKEFQSPKKEIKPSQQQSLELIKTTIGVIKGNDGVFYNALLIEDGENYSYDKWLVTYVQKYTVEVNKKDLVNLYELPKRIGGPEAYFGEFAKEKKKNPQALLFDLGTSLSDIWLLEKTTKPPLSTIKYSLMKDLGFDVLLGSYYALKDELFKNDAYKDFPFVASNVFYKTKKKGEEQKPVFKEYLIKEYHNLTIGIIGLVSTTYKKRLVSDSLQELEFIDSSTIAEKVINKLRDKVDLLIALVDLEPDELVRIENSSGIDMILGKRHYVLPPFPLVTHKTLTDREKGTYAFPFYSGSVAQSYITNVDLTFDSKHYPRFTTLEETKIPLSITSPHNDSLAGQLNELIFDMFSHTEILLPDYKDLYPQRHWSDVDKYPTYDSEEVARLAAHIMLQETDAEVSIYFKKESLNASLTGTVPLFIVENWFNESEQHELVTLLLRGSEIKKLIAKQKAHEETRDSTKMKFQLQGISLEKVMINDRPINDDELYKVVTIRKCIESDDFHELKTGARIQNKFLLIDADLIPDSRKGDYVILRDLIIAYLKKRAEEKSDDVNQKIVQTERQERKKLTDDEKIKLTQQIETNYRKHIVTLIEDTDITQGPYFRLNLKKIGLDFRKINLNNNLIYTEVRDSRIQSFDESFIRALADISFEIYDKRWIWETGSKLNYARVKLYIPQADPVVNIPKDDLLFFSEYSFHVFEFNRNFFGQRLGPFIRIAYDTQIEDPEDIPKRKELSAIPGISLLQGSIFRATKLGAVIDQDYSTSPSNREYGIYVASEQAKLVSHINSMLKSELEFKYFFDSAADTADDLGIELDYTASLMIPIFKKFYLAPYGNFFLFRGKIDPLTDIGTSITYGISLEFSEILKPSF